MAYVGELVFEGAAGNIFRILHHPVSLAAARAKLPYQHSRTLDNQYHARPPLFSLARPPHIDLLSLANIPLHSDCQTIVDAHEILL